MLTIHRILHPTDFSDGADAALAHAVHLARHFEAALDVLHVLPALGEDPIATALDAASGGDAILRRLRAEAETRLAMRAETARAAGYRVRPVLTQGRATGALITDYVRREGLDLVVMGTHGWRGLKHLLLGSVAEEVVHRAPCPVLTVRQPPDASAEPRPIQRILVGVDFSAPAAPLIRTARALAAGYGAFLDVVHVVKPLPVAVTFATTLSLHDLAPDLMPATRTRLEQRFEEAGGPDVPVAFHVVEGDPARRLVHMAEALSADLIVVAPRDVGGVERMLLGSVAERVVRTAACPVLVAKTKATPEAPPAEVDGAAPGLPVA